MARIWESRVVELSTSTGTGDFTLAGAPTSFRAFSSVCAVSDTCYYLIEGLSNGALSGEWEEGLGTYSAANTLTRTTVLRSSNANVAVNFSAGTKRVAITLAGQAMQFRGALVTKAADQTAADYTSTTDVAWDSESYDTDAIHDTVTNNQRLTVPAGVSYVRVSFGLAISSFTADLWALAVLRKNGTQGFTGGTGSRTEVGATTTHLNGTSPILAVTPGDYFTVAVALETDTSVTITAGQSWFAMEIIQ